jgi:hypothetical protein
MKEKKKWKKKNRIFRPNVRKFLEQIKASKYKGKETLEQRRKHSSNNIQ